AAEGDRSENAEYIYGKKRLREIDAKLARMQRLLDGARPIETTHIDSAIVGFGAYVRLDYGDCEKVWRIVGEGESEPRNGTISLASLLARAMLGNTVYDEFFFSVEGKRIEVSIVDVRYQP